VTHHCDKHVDKDYDNGDVVESKEERADAFDHRRGCITAGEADRVLATVLLRRILDLDAVDTHETEHRPEEAEQRPRQPDPTTAILPYFKLKLYYPILNYNHHHSLPDSV